MIAIENTRLFDELQQSNVDLGASVEREAALARISQRINEQPLDVDGTLLAIAEVARSLTDSDGSRVCLLDGDDVVGHQMSSRIPELAQFYTSRFLARVPLQHGMSIHVVSIREGRTVVLTDAHPEASWHNVPPEEAYRRNLRSMMAAPITREGVVLGSLYTVRTQVRPYNASEIASLEAFASQAATAIETARAQRELAERNASLAQGLERETATADILRTISESPGELERVLTAIGHSAQRLCEADQVFIAFTNYDSSEAGRWTAWADRRGLFVLPPAVDAPRLRPKGTPRRCSFRVLSTRGPTTIPSSPH